MANQYLLFLTIIRYFSLFHNIFNVAKKRCPAETVICCNLKQSESWLQSCEYQFPMIRSLAYFAVMKLLRVGTSISMFTQYIAVRSIITHIWKKRGKGCLNLSYKIMNSREAYGIAYHSMVCQSLVALVAPYTAPTGSRTTMVCVQVSSGCRSAACRSDRCFRRPRVAEFRPPHCWTASALCHRPHSELYIEKRYHRLSCLLIVAITLNGDSTNHRAV